VLAIERGLKLKDIARMIAPYPTLGEANKAAAGNFFKPKLFNNWRASCNSCRGSRERAKEVDMTSSAARPLQGQKALVIGASSGIGAAIACALARAGAPIGVNYRSHPNGADEIVREITGQGGAPSSWASIAALTVEKVDLTSCIRRSRP
jgi:hypothetical protein